MSTDGVGQLRSWVRRVGFAVVVLLVLAAQAACGDDDTEPATRRETTTSTTTAPGPCGLADATDITLSAGRSGAMLHAVVTGDGPTAVVLAHEAQEDACDWAFFVPELAADDRLILAFDFSGNGSSSDIGDGRLDLDLLAAVTEARNRGATRVVVIGASKGATAALAAAGTPDSGIDGVVSLSAAMSYLNADAEPGAASISIPVLFAAAESDGSTAETARTLSERCGCAYPDVLVLGGSRHGRRLLAEGPDGSSLRTAIDQLITRATR
ncbi:MAG: alpha/beta fold hydrolase [Acidimicrobiales bacterium]